MAYRRAHAFGRSAEAREDLSGDALLVANDREKKMLRLDRLVRSGFVHGGAQDLLRIRAEDDLCRGRLGLGRWNDLRELGAKLGQRDAELLEDPLDRLVGLIQFMHARDAEKEVFGPDVRVAHPDRLILRERERALGSVAESSERA